MVAAIALIVFGPEKLPEIARNVGKGIAEVRRMASSFRDEFETGLDVDDEWEGEPVHDPGQGPSHPVATAVANAPGDREQQPPPGKTEATSTEGVSRDLKE